MIETSHTHILILADEKTARCWESALGGPKVQIWLGREAIPPGQHPDIIVTNSSSTSTAARDSTGIVRIGAVGPADVLLAANCPPAELQLACQLLAEIVRLRRREQLATETQRELSRAAYTDSLTGLPNRRAWDMVLADRLHETRSSSQNLAFAILDLDNFKEVNDTLGHDAGDRVLRIVGRTLHERLRQDDFVARLGGDEFGLLLRTPTERDASSIVERLRNHISSALAEAVSLPVSATAGLATANGTASIDSADSLYHAACAALIAAKRGNKQRA